MRRHNLNGIDNVLFGNIRVRLDERINDSLAANLNRINDLYSIYFNLCYDMCVL